jgi:hypothetical protein
MQFLESLFQDMQDCVFSKRELRSDREGKVDQ